MSGLSINNVIGGFQGAGDVVAQGAIGNGMQITQIREPGLCERLCKFLFGGMTNIISAAGQPQGQTATPNAPGATGAAGAPGDTGPAGLTGPTATTGAPDATGATGSSAAPPHQAAANVTGAARAAKPGAGIHSANRKEQMLKVALATCDLMLALLRCMSESKPKPHQPGKPASKPDSSSKPDPASKPEVSQMGAGGSVNWKDLKIGFSAQGQEIKITDSNGNSSRIAGDPHYYNADGSHAGDYHKDQVTTLSDGTKLFVDTNDDEGHHATYVRNVGIVRPDGSRALIRGVNSGTQATAVSAGKGDHSLDNIKAMMGTTFSPKADMTVDKQGRWSEMPK